MNAYLVLSFIADDKPGVVEQISQVVVSHGGGWLESRMSRLAGKFAGIARVQVPADNLQALHDALDNLSRPGFSVTLERPSSGDEPTGVDETLVLNIVGQDRPGIVHEVSQALARHQINVTEMRSDVSSAPMTGEPWFEAVAEADMPAQVSLEKLQRELLAVGEELNVDIVIEA